MSLLCGVCKKLVSMTLWCQKEEKLTAHTIVATQRQPSRDGVIPLEVSVSRPQPEVRRGGSMIIYRKCQ